MAGSFSGLRGLVSGAGLGGLCLAQALRRADVDVQVFERDPSLRDRPQGSRLHIDPDGVGALADALPPGLFALFAATAMRAAPFTTLLDTDLAVRDEVRDKDAPARVPWTGDNVNRATVRQIPLAVLDAQADYGVCLVGGRRECFDAIPAHARHTDGASGGGSPPDLRRASSAALQQIATGFLAGGPTPRGQSRRTGTRGRASASSGSTSVPADYPPPHHVTLLSDAVHAMPPRLGRGANVALRNALAAYEAESTAYGFDVVRRSAAMGTRLVGQHPLPACRHPSGRRVGILGCTPSTS